MSVFFGWPTPPGVRRSLMGRVFFFSFPVLENVFSPLDASSAGLDSVECRQLSSFGSGNLSDNWAFLDDPSFHPSPFFSYGLFGLNVAFLSSRGNHLFFPLLSTKNATFLAAFSSPLKLKSNRLLPLPLLKGKRASFFNRTFFSRVGGTRPPPPWCQGLHSPPPFRWSTKGLPRHLLFLPPLLAMLLPFFLFHFSFFQTSHWSRCL